MAGRPYTSVCAFVVVALVVLFCSKALQAARPDHSVLLETTDVDALIAFKNRITHDPNNVLESWDPSLVDACTWYHVTCDANHRVVRVDLGNYGLSGTLAPELGNLDALQYLELYRNNFSGPLPKELGKLKSLVALDLFENHLTGSIPQEFDHFEYPHNLKFLGLQNNKLTGSIAATLGIIDLINLNVSSNDLDGFLPTTFSRYNIDSFYPGNSRLCGGPPINKPC